MNTSLQTISGKAFAATAVASLVLAGCASAPVSPQGAADVRTKLTRLQTDPNLANRAPVAQKEAETAVKVAEEPLAKNAAATALGAHRVYMADRKVEIAIANAATRYTEEQRAQLAEQRERSRLDARTREADQAKQQADIANAQADMARSDANASRAAAADAARDATLQADMARSDSEAARIAAAADAARQADELQRQIDVLHAEATDRGLVVTLGDVLFATGRSDVKVGATGNLDKLVAFLNKYPNRNVAIEGHTDNVGSDESNQNLSQRRADSVKSYLMQQGIASQRLAASGKGESQPVTDNDSATGRQQNRRVEVIIENPSPATASTSAVTGSR